jgi:chromosomal replication initiation ATPase DnaA
MTTKKLDDQAKLRKITRIVCEHFCLTPQQLESKSRTEHAAVARNIAMFVAVQYGGLKTTTTGHYFHCTHGNICHASKAIRTRMELDPVFHKVVIRLVCLFNDNHQAFIDSYEIKAQVTQAAH